MRENYYRHLNFNGYFNRQADKKLLSAKALVESIKVLLYIIKQKLCGPYASKRNEKGTCFITPTLSENEQAEFTFYFPDPSVHKDLYKMILVLCEQKMSVAEIVLFLIFIDENIFIMEYINGSFIWFT